MLDMIIGGRAVVAAERFQRLCQVRLAQPNVGQ